MSTLSHRLDVAGDRIVVSLEGALGFASNEEFRRMLFHVKESPRRKTVALDLARVTAIDSIGVGLLHIAREDFAALGSETELSNASGGVEKLLRLTNAAARFGAGG
jgi:anti-anti-sigma factor